jgi:predicted RNase H-like nuclease (RuvC/YqgF family)
MSEIITNEDRPVSGQDVKDIVRQAIQEFVQSEQRKAEPAYKTELQDERKRRESLEARLNQLVEENKRARAMAEEADRNSQIRSELQRLGISKVDLAFRAVKDEITRSEDGRLHSKGPDAKSLQEYLTNFVQENPELLPARISGGSGAKSPVRNASLESSSGIELDKIKPGMKKEDLDQVRAEIARLAQQAIRGL